MNKNPLLIKNFLTGKIPFMKGKTLSLYRKFLSENKFKKAFSVGDKTETLSAYTMNAGYDIDFVFDQSDISPVTYFSENEWVFLGLALRAYKEVEGINLMHLYNCLYTGTKNKVVGKVVVGRPYTLYTYSQLPITLTLPEVIVDDKPATDTINNLAASKPLVFWVTSKGFAYQKPEEEEFESLVDIEIEFSNLKKYSRATLIEGNTYGGLRFNGSDKIIPELLKEGEYSSKLVEFFAGTLITPKSDPKLISSVNYGFRSNGVDLWDKAKKDTPGIYNKDGYVDRRVDV